MSKHITCMDTANWSDGMSVWGQLSRMRKHNIIRVMITPHSSDEVGQPIGDFFILAGSQNCVFSGLLAREDC